MKGKDDFMKNVDESEYSIEYPDSDTPTLTKLRFFIVYMPFICYQLDLTKNS